MTHIQKLLDRYQAPYVPGEKRSNNYNRQIKIESRHKNRLLLLDTINNELPYSIKLNKHEKELCTAVLEIFKNDIKHLNRQATEEQILLSIIFTIKKRVKPQLNIEYYSIFKKYQLNCNTLLTILCRLTNYYMVHNPMVIQETTRYDHELLSKNNPTTNG